MRFSWNLLSLLLFSWVVLQKDWQHHSSLAEARSVPLNHFHLRPHLPKLSHTPTIMASAVTTKEETKKPPFVLFRIPSAFGSTIHTLCMVFLQSAMFMVPVGLIVKVGSRPQIPTNFQGNVKHWLSEGVKVGFEWARISALFSGGEVFCEKLRLVCTWSDRWMKDGHSMTFMICLLSYIIHPSKMTHSMITIPMWISQGEDWQVEFIHRIWDSVCFAPNRWRTDRSCPGVCSWRWILLRNRPNDAKQSHAKCTKPERGGSDQRSP